MIKSNRIQVVIFILLIVGFASFNKLIMPNRKELTELELTKVIGMDRIDDGKYRVEQTIVRIKTEEASSASGSKGGNSNKDKPKIFSVRGVTFSDAIRSFQTYIDKSLSGSHIKYMLLGEDFCKNDITLGIDFNARDYEVRLNANVYITKKSSARDFITKVVNNEYGLDDKLKSMEKNNEAKNVSYNTSLLQLLSMLARKDSCGLVPTLEIISPEGDTEPSNDEESSQNIQDFQSPSVDKEESSETFFDFSGYAIIKERKLIGYLNREESITCNILKNNPGGTNVNIDMGDNNVISLAMLIANTGYKFIFDGDKLSEVIIDIEVKSNFEEISIPEDVLKSEKIIELQEKQSEQIKREIEKIVEKLKEYKCDFISMNDMAKIQHPYKYEKIKDKWSEELINAKFTINVKTKILRTYDVLTLND